MLRLKPKINYVNSFCNDSNNVAMVIEKNDTLKVHEIYEKEFACRIMHFLESLREAPGLYKMSFSSHSSLISTCFASFIHYGLHKFIGEMNSESKKIVNLIIKHRFADGTFWDQCYPMTGTATHDSEYLRLQFTTLAINSLNVCGYIEHIKVNYLSELFDPQRLQKWINSLDWRNAWLQGNRIMFLGIIFLHNWEKFGDQTAKNAFDYLLECLNKIQDPSTGFWGTKSGASLHNAMAGAFHLFLLYDYIEHPYKYLKQIIDNTLKLQNKYDNLFSPYGGGSACDDMDGIYTLISCVQKIHYRKSEVDNALKQAYYTLINIQNKDAGFPYTIRNSLKIDLVRYIFAAFLKKMNNQERKVRLRNLPIIIKKRCLLFQFSGNPKSIVLPHESDLFSTWFRLCALALIELYFDTDKWKNGLGWWNFLPSAGLGWYKLR